MTERCYKFLAAGSRGPLTGYAWPVPAGAAPGPWVVAPGEPDVCRNGLHACRPAQLPFWLHDELWEVELGDPVLEHAGVLVGGRARLLHRLGGWDRSTALDFARACVWRARRRAVAALRAAGRTADADGLEQAADLDEVTARAESAAAGGPASLAAGYLRDAVAFSVTSPVTAGFIAARLARAAERTDPEGAAASERAEQARWLTDRLQLTDS